MTNMQRFRERYVRNSCDAGALYLCPAYVLERIKGEALALLASRPDSSWLRDQACVVVGYVEAFAFYQAGEFPWGHVTQRLSRMRRIIFRAEHLAKKMPHLKAA